MQEARSLMLRHDACWSISQLSVHREKRMPCIVAAFGLAIAGASHSQALPLEPPGLTADTVAEPCLQGGAKLAIQGPTASLLAHSPSGTCQAEARVMGASLGTETVCRSGGETRPRSRSTRRRPTSGSRPWRGTKGMLVPQS